MFSTIQRLLFRKRKLVDRDDGDCWDDADGQPTTAEPIENIVVQEEQGEGDMRDWTKIIPSNNSSLSRHQQQRNQQQNDALPKNQNEQQPHDKIPTDVPTQIVSTDDCHHTASSMTPQQYLADHDEKVARQIQQQEEMWNLQRQQQQQQPNRNNPFFHAPSLSPSETMSSYQRISVYQKQREMQHKQLNQSIRKTFADLVGEQPDKVEQDQIRRAIELSMLDCAIVPSTKNIAAATLSSSASASSSEMTRPPHIILGVVEDATQEEIKTSYRRLCRLHHPDKNQQSSQAVAQFQEISRAYKDMMQMAFSSSSHHHRHSQYYSSASASGTSADPFMACGKDEVADAATRLKSTAHWDRELQDHRRLVNDLFQADGIDLQACVHKQQDALELLGLTFRDAGATNRNERDEIITNSCFYLSLAVSLLWGIGVLDHDNSDWDGLTNIRYDGFDDDLDTVMAQSEAEGLQVIIGDQALLLKRGIEASVVKAHPEWAAQGKVGEEVQAFSDFLVYVLDTLMAEIAVVVFDNTSGFCDVYKGKNYEKVAVTSPHTAQANTLTLRYIPGHYQPLIPSRRNARRPLLHDILSALDNYGVLYAVCDGN